MRVLVTGANGFIGARIAAALREAGHDVVAALRRPASAGTARNAIACDLARDTDPQIWKQRLAGIEAVVNCAGILRETRRDKFQSVHIDAPLALFRACAATGVRRVIQISALGEPQDGEFIASKHRCDQGLAALDLDWLVLRPGLVYSAHGAYGGTSLLRALAVLPGVMFLPGDGEQRLRPLACEDLARAVVAALARPTLRAHVIELVGPNVLTFHGYLQAWRNWFGLAAPRMIATPRWLERMVVVGGEAYGRGPLCRVIANLLERGRVGAEQAPTRLAALLGFNPQTLQSALAQRPAQAADVLAAQWYTLRIMLLFILGVVWIASGCVGLALPTAAAQAALPAWPATLVRVAGVGASIADVALGVALCSGRATRRVLAAMLGFTVAYTVLIGATAPQHWFDPFGGLLKNLLVMALLGTLLVLEPRR